MLNDYNEFFRQFSSAQKRIGLHPKDGLYGELRNAVHGVEELLTGADFRLLSDLMFMQWSLLCSSIVSL